MADFVEYPREWVEELNSRATAPKEVQWELPSKWIAKLQSNRLYWYRGNNGRILGNWLARQFSHQIPEIKHAFGGV